MEVRNDISKSNQFTKTRSGQTLGKRAQNGGEMRSVFTGLGFIHATVVGYIGQGEVSKRPSIPPLSMLNKIDHFAKTGSGQTNMRKSTPKKWTVFSFLAGGGGP